MKFIINLSYFDIIEGFSDEKVFPIIFEEKQQAEEVIKMINNHDKAVIFNCQDDNIRRLCGVERIDSLGFDLEKEKWFVSAFEGLEYELIYFKDDEETYKNLFDGYMESYNDFKENSYKDYISRSLSYIKVNNKLIIADWSSFSNLLKKVEVKEIKSAHEEESIIQRVEDLNYNNIFSAKTTLPMYSSISIR